MGRRAASGQSLRPAADHPQAIHLKEVGIEAEENGAELKAASGDPEIVGGNRPAFALQVAAEVGVGIGSFGGHRWALDPRGGKKEAEFFAVPALALSAGKAGQQFTDHGDAQQEPPGSAHHFDAVGISPCQAPVGVGVKGDGAQESAPEIRVHLLEGGDRGGEGLGFLGRPGTGQGIEIAVGPAGLRGIPSQPLQDKPVEADAQSAGLAF